MAEIIIDFTGDTSKLTTVIDALQTIVDKEGEIGQKWKQVVAQWNASNSTAAQNTTKVVTAVQQVETKQSDLETQTRKTTTAFVEQQKTGTDASSKVTASIDDMAEASKSLNKALATGTYKKYFDDLQSSLGVSRKELAAYIQNLRQAAKEPLLTDEQLKSLGLAEEKTDILSKSIADLANASKSLDQSIIAGAYTQTLAEIQQSLKLTKDQIIDFVVEAKRSAEEKLFNEQDTKEAEQLKVSITAMDTVLKEFGVTEQAIVERTQTLSEAFTGMIAAFVKSGKSIGSTDFTSGLKELQSQVKLTNAEVVRYLNTAKKNFQTGLINETDAKKIQQYQQAISVTEAEIQKFGVKEAEVGEKTLALRTRLQNAKEAFSELIEQGIDSGPAFDEAKKNLQELSEQSQKVNELTANLGSETRNLEGFIELARGAAAGYELMIAAEELWGETNQEVQEGLRKLMAVMALLNGLQEIQRVLSKESQANQLLETLFRKQNAAAAGAQAISEEALNAQKAIAIAQTRGITIAEAQQLIATESATAAQKGLNAAMFANPVGIILASVVALYGAYQLYTHTIGEATEAEKEHKAELEAIDEVNKKAIDSLAEERAHLEALLVPLRDDAASRVEKERSLNELSEKYPEYLGQLTSENVLTKEGNDLINAQIDLIQKKARARAAEDLYAEKLKEQLKLETEIARIQSGGELTSGQKLRAIPYQSILSTATASETVIKLLQDDLKELEVSTDASFHQLNQTSETVQNVFKGPKENLEQMTRTLDFFIGQSKGFQQQLAILFKAGSTAPNQAPTPKVAFDPKAHDEEFELKKAAAERELSLIDKNNAAEIAKAKEKLAKIEKDYVLSDDRITEATKLGQSKRADAEAEYNAEVQQLNQEALARDYKARVDNANQVLTLLEANGKKESDAYFNAKIVAIKAAAAQQINAERFNAEAVKRIYAELNLALKQNEIDRAQSRLSAEQSLINARISLARKGSKEEYQARIDLLNIEQARELETLGITEEKKTEIRAKHDRERRNLDIQYRQQQLDDQISLDNAALENFQLSEEARLNYTLDRLETQRKKELLNAEDNAKKIAEINAKYDAQALEAEQQSLDRQLSVRLKMLDVYGRRAAVSNAAILNSQFATETQKLIANNALEMAEEAKLREKYAALEEKRKKEVNGNKILSDKQYFLELKELDNQMDDVHRQHADRELAIYRETQQKKIEEFQSFLSVLKNGIAAAFPQTSGATAFLNNVLDFGASAQKIFGDLKTQVEGFDKIINSASSTSTEVLAASIQKQQAQQQAYVEAMTAVISTAQATINQVFADASARRQQELNDRISALEEQKNRELDNANLTEKQKQDIQARYAQRERQEKIRAFNAEKQAKAIEIIINGALAVVKAAPNPVLMALAGIVTAAQLVIVRSQPTPKFREGVVDIDTKEWLPRKKFNNKIAIDGPGTSTSDSIAAWLSKGETVTSADKTAKHKPALNAIHNDTFEQHYILKKDVFPSMNITMDESAILRHRSFSFPHVPENVTHLNVKNTEINYEKLAQAIKDIIPDPKEVYVNIDKSGIHTIIKDYLDTVEIKNKRYSMR